MSFLWLCLGLLNIYHPDISIQGQYQVQDRVYVYGAYEDSAYLMVYNDFYEEIYFELSYQDHDVDCFEYMALVEHGILLVNAYEENNQQGYEVIKIDNSGQILDKLILEDMPVAYHNHHYHLVLEVDQAYIYMGHDLVIHDGINDDKINIDSSKQYQGQLILDDQNLDDIKEEAGLYKYTIKDQAYTYVFSLRIDPKIDIQGEHYLNGYKGQVDIVSDVPIIFEGKSYQGRLTLSVAGKHELVFDMYGKKESLDIYMYPTVYVYMNKDSYVLSDRHSFNQAIYLYIDDGLLKINDTLYQGELIRETGSYKLDVFVEDLHMETMYFSLKPMMMALESNNLYQVVYYVFGNGFLNGEPVEGIVHIDQPGLYRLQTYDQGILYEEILIEIHTKETVSDASWVYMIIGGVFILVCIYIYFKK